MLTRFKFCFFLIISIYGANLFAAILDKSEAEKADINLLKDETTVFQSIGMSIALSLAQCEGVDLCSLTVDEDEIKELINVLDARINSLTLKQEQAEDPVEFDKVLTAYINERDNYSTHLEKLKSLTSSLDEEGGLLDDSSQLQSEPDFPVDSAKNEELLQYLNDLEQFEEEDIEDDDTEWDLPELPPELEDSSETP